MDFCSDCNTKVEANSKFCCECGAQLSVSETQEKSIFKAEVKIAHTNETTEKMLKGLGGSLASASNVASSKFLIFKRRVLKPIFFLLVFIIVAIGLIQTAKYYYTELYLEPQTEFYGIKLLDKKTDVRLVKGTPHKEGENVWEYDLSDDNYLASYGNLGWLLVRFEGGAVKKIGIISGHTGFSQGFENHNMFQKIYSSLDSYSSFEFMPYQKSYNQILERFGEPSLNSISDDKSTRTITYNDLNIFFSFKKNEVIAYGVFDGDF